MRFDPSVSRHICLITEVSWAPKLHVRYKPVATDVQFL